MFSVVAHKCAELSTIFNGITPASRTVSKYDSIASSVKGRYGVNICTAQIGADPFMEDLNKYGLPWTCIELNIEPAKSPKVVP